MFETGAFLLNSSGNIDRLVTDDGKEYHLEPTLAIEATNNANAAARLAKETIERLEEDERVRDQNEEARKQAENGRKSVEEERVVSENGRVRADEERAERVNTALDLVGKATTSANDAADRATASASTADASARRADDAAAVARENVLQGTFSGGVVHVEDAYPAMLRECKVLGKSVQTITTGKNLLDIPKTQNVEWVGGSATFKRDNDGFVSCGPDDGRVWGFDQSNVKFDIPVGTYTLSVDVKHAAGELGGIRLTKSDGSDLSVDIGLRSTGRRSAKITVDTPITVGLMYKLFGAVIRVQLERGAEATAYEPYTGGKPSPSPDYPQEITNLNKAEIITTNKNLIPLSAYVNTDSWSSSGLTIKNNHDGTFSYNGKMTDNGTINAWLAGGYGIKDVLFVIPPGSYICSGCKLFYDQEDAALAHGSNNDTDAAGMFTVTRPMRVTGIRNKLLDKTDAPISGTWKPMLEVGLEKTEFMASNYTTTPIDLHGNELCSLPNGVKDEVVIDAEGNVSLIKRLWKLQKRIGDMNNWEAYPGWKFTDNELKDNVGAGIDTYINGISSHFQRFSVNTLDAHYGGTLYISQMKQSELIAKYPDEVVTFIGERKEPQTIPLGKVELHALPEATSNVWNDGNINTDISITYVRDVNMVIGKLEQSLAAIPVIAAASL